MWPTPQTRHCTHMGDVSKKTNNNRAVNNSARDLHLLCWDQTTLMGFSFISTPVTRFARLQLIQPSGGACVGRACGHINCDVWQHQCRQPMSVDIHRHSSKQSKFLNQTIGVNITNINCYIATLASGSVNLTLGWRGTLLLSTRAKGESVKGMTFN